MSQNYEGEVQPAAETIGQLYDSLQPGESTHRWLLGERWRLTRLPAPPPMEALAPEEEPDV